MNFLNAICVSIKNFLQNFLQISYVFLQELLIDFCEFLHTF
jgi:hypothetical protein